MWVKNCQSPSITLSLIRKKASTILITLSSDGWAQHQCCMNKLCSSSPSDANSPKPVYLEGGRISLLFQIRWQVCCVFTIAPLKIKMQSSWCKKCRIWEMKGANCTKCLAKNQVCAVIHRQDIQRTFCSNLTALYGDAMFVCLWRTLIWQLGTNTNIHSWVFKLWREFIPWATHED